MAPLSQIVFLFGNFLGLPIPSNDGSFPSNGVTRKLQIIYGIWMTGYSITICILVEIRSHVQTKAELGDILGNTYYMAILYLYGYMLIRRKFLSKILRKLNCLEKDFQCRYHQRITKQKDIIVLKALLLILTSAIAETMLFDIDMIERDNELQDATFLERYFDANIYKLKKVGIQDTSTPACQIALATIHFLTKVASLASDYGDAICIILSYRISALLTFVNEYIHNYGEQQVTNGDGVAVPMKKKIVIHSKLSWSEIYRDVVELRNFSDEVSTFLSPIIFASLTVNVFQLITNLNLGINPAYTVVFRPTQIPYVCVSCLHFACRIGFLIHFTSQVQRASELTMNLIEDVPVQEQNEETERILSALRRKLVGITFFDTILMTRHVFISILNFVFTLQIIILQATSGYNKNDI